MKREQKYNCVNDLKIGMGILELCFLLKATSDLKNVNGGIKITSRTIILMSGKRSID